jgi:hypothetical protein
MQLAEASCSFVMDSAISAVRVDRFHFTPSTRGNPMATRSKSRAKTKQGPVHELRLGRIRAAIWENETQNGTLHNVTVTRLYKNDNDEWQDSSSFGRDDLPLVGKVLDRAHTWIFANSGGMSNGNGNGHDDEDNGETPF